MGIWRDKKRRDWIYTFQYRGRTYGGRGFKTKAEARAARAERRKQVKSEIPATPADMDFKAAANFYLDWAQRRFAEKTYKYKAYVFKSFLAHHGNLRLKQVTPQVLHQYLNTRSSNNNYNAHRKDLCAFFTYVREQLKITIPNPCWDLDRMPHTPKKKDPPSEEEILCLVMAADPAEERPLMLVIVHTLARVDEVLRLRWEDVNFERRWVRLWTRKSKDGSWEGEELEMNEDLYQTLRDLWRRRKQNKWVFCNPQTGTRYKRRPKLMRSLCNRAGIPHCGFHALRHGIATLLQDKEKVGTKTVSAILRHKSVRTTEIYLHSPRRERLEALRRLEGRFLVADLVADPDKYRSPKLQAAHKGLLK